MIGSMTAGVGAMRSFVRGIEVIGNNISNINTVGYKGAKTRFEDTFSNTLQRGTGNSGAALGSNTVTQQIGTGAKIATIKTQFTQGALETTGGLTDLAVSGEGFFRVRDTLQGLEYATRAGDFRVDDQGYLVTNSGFKVQGLGFDDATEASGIYNPASVALDTANLRDVRINGPVSVPDDPTTVGIDESTLAPPRMETFQIDQGGNVNIFLSNGTSFVRGKILLQRFNDPAALVKEGNNLFAGLDDAGPTETWPATRVSGVVSTAITAAPLAAAQNGNGRMISGSLEMANIDLTEEFANLITTQRAFQSASKLITTSDEILQDIVNLKR